MTTRYTRAADALWRRTSTTVLVLPPGSVEVQLLSGSAVTVWEELADECDANELVTRVAQAYAVDETVCASGVRDALGQLRDSGAIVGSQ